MGGGVASEEQKACDDGNDTVPHSLQHFEQASLPCLALFAENDYEQPRKETEEERLHHL